MSLKREGKITFLKSILDNRDVLFGAFSDTLTKENKTEMWKGIHNIAISLGLVPGTKTYLYTRDTYWQNLKKYTMKKIDNSRQTGTGGGPECKLSETDNVILDIIGRDTPIVKGLNILETWDKDKKAEPVIHEDTGVEEDVVDDDPVAKPTNYKRKAAIQTTSEEAELRRKKLKLSIEIMEKESLLKSMEILKMERELGLPTSKFTIEFPTEYIFE